MEFFPLAQCSLRKPCSTFSPISWLIATINALLYTVAPDDYEAVVSEQLVFSNGFARRCHTINVVNDNVCEQPAEHFFSNLMFVSGQQLVTINPAQTTIFIDDDNEPECGKIINPRARMRREGLL